MAGKRVNRKRIGGKATEKSLKCLVNPFQHINSSTNYKIPDGANNSVGYSREQFRAGLHSETLSPNDDPDLWAAYHRRVHIVPCRDIMADFQHVAAPGANSSTFIKYLNNSQVPTAMDIKSNERWRLVSQGCRVKAMGPPKYIKGTFVAYRLNNKIDSVLTNPLGPYLRCEPVGLNPSIVTDSIANIHKYDFNLKPRTVENNDFKDFTLDTNFDSIVIQFWGAGESPPLSFQFVAHYEILLDTVKNFRGQDPTSIQYDPIGLEHARIKVNSSIRAGIRNGL